MPAKNKKTKANIKKNIKNKPVKKSSRSTSKKTVKAKIAKRTSARPAVKKKSATKTLLRKSPTKKKRSSGLATKSMKKKATIAKGVGKKSKPSKIKSGVKIKTTKKASSVKPTSPNKKAIKPVMVTGSMKAAKKSNVLAKQAEASVNTQKPIDKPHVAEIARLIKAAAKKNTNQPTPQRVRRPGAGPSGFLPYEVKRDEDYMNDAQLAHFQRVLHLWKEQLYAGRDATTQHMRDDTINFPDPLDRAAVEEEHTLEWRAREREHRLITKIDQALVRIKQGDYGYCEACGAEIGVRRLEARPTATQCIDCKTIDEIRERHTGTVE